MINLSLHMDEEYLPDILRKENLQYYGNGVPLPVNAIFIVRMKNRGK
jgi:hypothetical protein